MNRWTIAALAALAAVLFAAVVHAGPSILDAWDAEECAKLDRQARHGYPVRVPDWCRASAP